MFSPFLRGKKIKYLLAGVKKNLKQNIPTPLNDKKKNLTKLRAAGF